MELLHSCIGSVNADDMSMATEIHRTAVRVLQLLCIRSLPAFDSTDAASTMLACILSSIRQELMALDERAPPCLQQQQQQLEPVTLSDTEAAAASNTPPFTSIVTRTVRIHTSMTTVRSPTVGNDDPSASKCGDFSLSFWLWVDKLPKNQSVELIGWESAGSATGELALASRCLLRLDSSGFVFTLANRDESEEVSARTVEAPSKAQWLLLCCALRNRELRLYINGVLAASHTHTADLSPLRCSRRLVVCADSLHGFEGRLADMRWYDSFRSDESIAQCYVDGPHRLLGKSVSGPSINSRCSPLCMFPNAFDANSVCSICLCLRSALVRT